MKKSTQPLQKQSIAKKKPANFNVPNAFDVFLEKKSFYLLLSLLALLIIAVFRNYLFFDKLYLFKDIGSDTLTIYYPLFASVSNLLHTEGYPMWSFYSGMGQSVYMNLFSPFSLQYLFDSHTIPYIIAWLEVSKIAVAGIVFYFYLQTIPFTKYTSIIGALLFAFSGYMVLGSGWYNPSNEVVFIALFLLAFEKLFKNGIWLWFPLVFYLFANFSLVFFSIFFFFYILLRFLDEKGWQPKQFGILISKIVGLGVLGLALNALFLFPALWVMVNSPRVSGADSYFNTLMLQPIFALTDSHQLSSIFLRLFSNDMMGTGQMSEQFVNNQRQLISDFKGWNNYLESPILYIGLLSLLLAPQIFISLNKRKKVIYSIFLALLIIPLFLPYFRYAFWFFAGDYYRTFSFFVSLVILFYALYSLNELIKSGKLNLIVLAITTILLLILLNYPYQFNGNNLTNLSLKAPISLLIIVYATLIYLFSISKLKLYSQIALISFICIELLFLSNITVNKRDAITKNEFESKTGTNDYTIEAVNDLKQKDKSFYRLNKDYFSGVAVHKGLNDAQEQKYFGTQSYSSFNQLNYIQFLQELNVIKKGDESSSRWSPGVSQRPLLQTLTSVKYNLSKNQNPEFLGFGYSQIGVFNDVKVLKNNYYLPLGFSYNKRISKSDFDKLSVFQKDLMLLSAVVYDDSNKQLSDEISGLKQLTKADTIAAFNFDIYRKLVDTLKLDTLKINHVSQNKIDASIELKSRKLIFLSIPHDLGWSATVDNKPTEILKANIGFMGLILDKGTHNISLQYRPPFLFQGLIISILAIFVYLGLVAWYFFKLRKIKAVE